MQEFKADVIVGDWANLGQIMVSEKLALPRVTLSMSPLLDPFLSSPFSSTGTAL